MTKSWNKDITNLLLREFVVLHHRDPPLEGELYPLIAGRKGRMKVKFNPWTSARSHGIEIILNA